MRGVKPRPQKRGNDRWHDPAFLLLVIEELNRRREEYDDLISKLGERHRKMIAEGDSDG